MRTVMVDGDLIQDVHLVKKPDLPSGYVDALPATVESTTRGGAWYLAELIERACGDLVKAGQCAVVRPAVEEAGQAVVRAYSVWSKFPKSEFEPKAEVWRISEFLGCEVPADDAKAAGERVASGAANSNQVNGAPDLLVLDDLHLGFAKSEDRWPAALREGGRPCQIVIKLGGAPVDGPLWQHLLDHHADRLTVVVGIASLRDRGADVSTGLSWDQTIEDLDREFREGPSSQDLARCKRTIVYFPGGSGAASYTRCRLRLGPVDGADDPFESPHRERAVFERFWYLADELEGAWRAARKGTVFGAGSIVTAAVVRHILVGADCPLYIAVGRALTAVRHATDQGGQVGKDGAIHDLDTAGIEDRLRFLTTKDKQDKNLPDPAFAYFTAYPHSIFHSEKLREEPGTRSNLLRDVAGPSVEYMTDLAYQVVVAGVDQALRGVPRAKYAKYETVDREEIERLNAVRALMLNYRANPNDKRPLSIAVFGQPGSGKSFAIKQLAESLFGDKNPVLEFNLSQFDPQNPQQLHQAFHRVRDASIKGAVPLVFWDEFDSDGRTWLKHFLAPMQDAEFRVGSDLHAFGKAFFVFAGGTEHSFRAFDKTSGSPSEAKEFRELKGPDFISRLRGFIDIKGPNPTGGKPADDPAYVIRRAIILRSSLQQFYPQLLKPNCRVQASVIRGFLGAEEFWHGARSIQALLGMCQLHGASQFGLAQLNAPSLLAMHVSADFMDVVRRAALDSGLYEVLSEAAHEGWKTCRERDGWTYAPVRDNALKQHPQLVPYAQLPGDWKERNRNTARVIPAKLAEMGYEIVRVGAPGAGAVLTKDEQLAMARLEHDRWLREHLIQGYEYHTATREALRQHNCVAQYDALSEEDRKLDLVLPELLSQVLSKYGFALRKRP